MLNYEYFGYLGILCAFIYRFPQIQKIYKTKKADDISKKTYIIHNCSYIFLCIYLVSKPSIDYLLLIYEISGLLQNLMIICMKLYYKNRKLEEPEDS